MPDPIVLLAPLVLLPICLLLVFVGCQEILGLEEGQLAPPPDPPPDVEFVYGVLPANVVRIGWQYDTTGLEYEGGGSPPSFNPGPFERVRNGVPALDPDGETVPQLGLGAPIGGTLTCQCRHFLQGDPTPVLQTVSKAVGDADFPVFELTADLQFV